MFLKEIKLQCRNLSSAENFYEKALGLTVVENNKQRISFSAGTSLLTFERTEKSDPYYHFAFNIPTNTIEAALKWIGDKAKIISDYGKSIVDFKNWNAESVYFSDPLGNIVELIARHDLSNTTDEHFGPKSFLSISEIGVVVNDIKESCATFFLDYDLLPYQKQPVLDNFAALGDANGLLILSTPDRHWYPTELAVKKFPLNIQFENRRGIFTLDL